ncbi:MAG: DUF4097 family beta strand repeat protein [Clostridia bacterium]|nr:DUF4097 family beta strand repeat protein [Clostridia bacterium]
MIDEIFSEMKMSAENLALRDELMANAQARYEDSIAAGKSEEEAFREVADSLEDVQSLLLEMNSMDERREQREAQPEEEEPVIELKIDPEEGAEPEAEEEKKPEEFDIGETLNRAFSALGEFGQSLMPQAKKIVKDVDSATGGVIVDLGRAVNKGMRDAQKAAGDAIDKLSGKKGEITIDFGGKPVRPQGEKTAAQVREDAEELRAQAELKTVAGDEDGAAELRGQADALETQADAMEQAEAIEQARRAAEAEAAAQQETPEEPEQPEEPAEPTAVYGADGELDQDAFSKTISDLAGEAERLAGEAKKMAKDVADQLTGRTDGERVTDGMTFPVAGLRSVSIKLDADDIVIEPTDGYNIVVTWDIKADAAGGEPECMMIDHALTIRRKNPDVFKTFFSVFKKSGGEIRVAVPRGYAADYTISTTSGDIILRDIDVDVLQVNTTSGDIRLEPEAVQRAKEIAANTVSGDIAISACADAVAVNGVSGDQFVSCDACSVSVNTVSGDIHVEGACESIDVNGVSGDIELLCTVAPTRSIDINTTSASARVALPADIRGFVAEISGIKGSIVNEFGPNRYATCALPIHMSTVSGQLLITRL